mmetsp:Transcript_53589/g.85209  ORF Transcript_53589/g.85209 Transcript_53589/m.85209 type:complete len:102 (+) Transcript_53589:546-851(+)
MRKAATTRIVGETMKQIVGPPLTVERAGADIGIEVPAGGEAKKAGAEVEGGHRNVGAEAEVEVGSDLVFFPVGRKMQTVVGLRSHPKEDRREKISSAIRQM